MKTRLEPGVDQPSLGRGLQARHAQRRVEAGVFEGADRCMREVESLHEDALPSAEEADENSGPALGSEGVFLRAPVQDPMIPGSRSSQRNCPKPVKKSTEGNDCLHNFGVQVADHHSGIRSPEPHSINGVCNLNSMMAL